MQKATNQNPVQEENPPEFSISNWNEEKLSAVGNDLLHWMQSKGSNFWIEEYLIGRGILPDMIPELASIYPKFDAVLQRAKMIQASRIQLYAVLGKINPAIAEKILATKHGIYSHSKPLY